MTDGTFVSPFAVEDPEALRQEADTWTSSARSSLSGPVEVAEDNGFAALGLPEVAKPTALAARGGCWFRDEGVERSLGG